ncbi:MAG: hypothetical protein IT487_06420 [Chromatiaceae bacterium]|nr:hypothetical protein [Chromatiaceae bacterium]
MTQALVTPIPPGALEQLRRKAATANQIQTWKPQPGDTLEGLIEGARKTDGPFGVQEQVLVRTPEGGLIAVWLTKWLTQQLRANGAELGDLLSLTFHGKELGKSGAAFNRMTLVTLKPA